MASPGTQASGFHGGGRLGRDSSRGTAGGNGLGAGAQALSKRTYGDTKFGNQKTKSGRSVAAVAAGDAARKAAGKATAGGGTTVSDQYTPGAVPNHPFANAPQIIGTLVDAIPGIGMLNSMPDVESGIENPKAVPQGGAVGRLLGADPGPQRGWQPDRYKGQANLTGIGDPGSASGVQREIAGTPLGAGTIALTGDSSDETDAESGGAGTSLYSDVTLRDRRKPRGDLTAGTRMALAL
jgi:hypothetical protein